MIGSLLWLALVPFGQLVSAAESQHVHAPASTDSAAVREESTRPTTRVDVRTAQAMAATYLLQLQLPNPKSSPIKARMDCSEHLKLIFKGLQQFEHANGAYPPAFNSDSGGRPLLSWRVLLLPYLGQRELYNKFKLTEPWDSDHNKSLLTKIPEVYVCPACDPALAREGRTTYLTARGDLSAFPGKTPTQFQAMSDGTTNTILTLDVSEKHSVPWTQPEDWKMGTKLETKSLFGQHPGGTNVGFAEGSTYFILESIKADVLLKLLTIRGGEFVFPKEF